MKFQLTNNEVRIEPTNICNACCVMCPREKMQRPRGAMSMELFKRIVDQCVKAGAEVISIENFGEPLIDPRIFDKAAYAKSKGLRTMTITNASLLNEERAVQMLKYFDVVRISMYGMTKKTYESVHKWLEFKTTKKNVDRFIKMNRGTTKISMYFLLLDENKHEKKLFLDTYRDKVDGISIWKPHNWTDGKKYRTVLPAKQSCGRPATGPLQVQWDGDVVPCCYDYNGTMVLGNLGWQTLGAIFRGRKYRKIVEAHAKNDFSKYPACNGCDQLNKHKGVLVYTNIKSTAVGKTNTVQFDLKGVTK